MHSRLTTGLILATLKTSAKSCRRKLLTPSDTPESVPSSTRPSSAVQNAPIWFLAGT